MEYLKNHIILIFIGSFVAGVIALCTSIFSDVLPIVLPSLKDIQIELYLKIILLLIFLLVITFILLLYFHKQTKQFKPFKKRGKFQNLKWIAHIKEYDPRQGWDIWINFICPIHKVYLGRHDAKVPDCCYGVLYCSHCEKEYPFKINDSIIHLEEVERNIKDKIVSTLRIKEK